jgi:hypothetical protein
MKRVLLVRIISRDRQQIAVPQPPGFLQAFNFDYQGLQKQVLQEREMCSFLHGPCQVISSRRRGGGASREHS